MINIFVWNCRGTCARDTIRCIRENISNYNSFIIALFETRVHNNFVRKNLMDRTSRKDGIFVEANGFARGI